MNSVTGFVSGQGRGNQEEQISYLLLYRDFMEKATFGVGEENAALHIDGITQCVHEIKGDVQESAIAQ